MTDTTQTPLTRVTSKPFRLTAKAGDDGAFGGGEGGGWCLMAWCISHDEELFPALQFLDGKHHAMLTNLIGGPEIVDVSGLPTVAVAKDRREIKSDIISIDMNGYYGAATVVTDRVKVAIERIEPGVHQFFPVTIENSAGKRLTDSFHIIRVRQIRCCVFFDESRHMVIGVVRAGLTKGKPIYNCREDGLVVSRKAMNGAHIFSTSVVASGLTIISDMLMGEFDRLNIQGFRRYKVEELERDWIPQSVVPELISWLQNNPQFGDQYDQYFQGGN